VNLPGFAAILFAVPREGTKRGEVQDRLSKETVDRRGGAKDWSKMLGAGYFRDRTVLITGASSGIGRDIAMSLSCMGAQVAMLARRKALLDELKRQVESPGARALPLGAKL
jgi:hypothetical protein